ncbi:unnamed protein product [Ostreobium quekettii]|uniref:Uncharacterized protein n=1 Tax=Ostreobium quekettii TaxID=121088 RepID=A0A8S1JBA2_9CHLO|nr:unnamed protein product [Ostreobium quekettii]
MAWTRQEDLWKMIGPAFLVSVRTAGALHGMRLAKHGGREGPSPRFRTRVPPHSPSGHWALPAFMPMGIREENFVGSSPHECCALKSNWGFAGGTRLWSAVSCGVGATARFSTCDQKVTTNRAQTMPGLGRE